MRGLATSSGENRGDKMKRIVFFIIVILSLCGWTVTRMPISEKTSPEEIASIIRNENLIQIGEVPGLREQPAKMASFEDFSKGRYSKGDSFFIVLNIFQVDHLNNQFIYDGYAAPGKNQTTNSLNYIYCIESDTQIEGVSVNSTIFAIGSFLQVYKTSMTVANGENKKTIDVAIPIFKATETTPKIDYQQETNKKNDSSGNPLFSGILVLLLISTFVIVVSIRKGRANQDHQKHTKVVAGIDSHKEEPGKLVLSIPGPEYDSLRSVFSTSDSKKTYKINAHRMTCTCPDFQQVRSAYAIDDIRRPCKHLVKYLVETNLIDSIDPLAVAYLSNGYPAHEQIVIATGPDELRFLLGYSRTNPWVNVVTLKKGEAGSYGYNLDEDRWSYHKSPAGIAEHLSEFIKETKYKVDEAQIGK